MVEKKNYIGYLAEVIGARNPLVAKKLAKNLQRMGPDHEALANEFLSKYDRYLGTIQKSLDYGVTCFLQMVADMLIERQKFLESGCYANTSYESVNQAIYSNPEVMDYHMHGLVLAQFLWPDQFERYCFFREHFGGYLPVRDYLEIGGGHGLYVMAARQRLAADSRLLVVDISKSSLDLAQGILDDSSIQFVQSDVFKFDPSQKFDFITVGEVLEHVEEPLRMLEQLKSMLKPGGHIFLTTPANAPMIDHIYLFRDEDEIRDLLGVAGLRIEREHLCYAEEVTPELARHFKIPLMYAAFLSAQDL
ncbi:class I SAM-dependent methyltransferase [bacterium]|nr:class I SAM-dependent methyltransferase [bacterium]